MNIVNFLACMFSASFLFFIPVSFFVIVFFVWNDIKEVKQKLFNEEEK